MPDIVAFLAARLDEDEAAAKSAARAAAFRESDDAPEWDVDSANMIHSGPYGYVVARADEVRDEIGGHIARWDPARVLAEVAAKRGRLREFETWNRQLEDVHSHPEIYSSGNRGEIQGMWMMARRAILWDALVYTDHPDYAPSWRLR